MNQNLRNESAEVDRERSQRLMAPANSQIENVGFDEWTHVPGIEAFQKFLDAREGKPSITVFDDLKRFGSSAS